jgi:hypothetical protein
MRVLKAVVLERLGYRMVNLDDTERGRPRGLAVGKGVQACPKDDVLTHPSLDGICKLVFREATAQHKG